MRQAEIEFAVLGAFYRGDDPLLLRRALESVYASTVLPSHFILVQDGPVSEDLSAVVGAFHKEKNFEHLVLLDNCGLAEALNHGLDSIKHEYVVRIDADDINVPERFEKLIQALDDGHDIVGSWIREFDAEGRSIAVRRVPCDESSIKQAMKYRNPFNHMSVAFRRSAVFAAGRYPNILLREDYGLWARLIAQGARATNLPIVLVNVSGGSRMYERRGGLKYALAEIQLQRHLLALGLQTLPMALVIGCLRAAIFILPSRLRGRFYLAALRTEE